jgi:hypothetical protein
MPQVGHRIIAEAPKEKCDGHHTSPQKLPLFLLFCDMDLPRGHYGRRLWINQYFARVSAREPN